MQNQSIGGVLVCVFDPAIVRPVAQLHSVLRRVDVDALESRNSLRLGNDLRSNQNRGDAVFASGLFQTLLPLGEARSGPDLGSADTGNASDRSTDTVQESCSGEPASDVLLQPCGARSTALVASLVRLANERPEHLLRLTCHLQAVFEVTLSSTISPLSRESASQSQSDANTHTSSLASNSPTSATAAASAAPAALPTAAATDSSDTAPMLLPAASASHTPDCDASRVTTTAEKASPGISFSSQAALPPQHAWVVWVDVSLTPRLWTTTTEWKGSASSTTVLNALQRSPASPSVLGKGVTAQHHLGGGGRLSATIDGNELLAATAQNALLLDCPVDPLQQSQHFSLLSCFTELPSLASDSAPPPMLISSLNPDTPNASSAADPKIDDSVSSDQSSNDSSMTTTVADDSWCLCPDPPATAIPLCLPSQMSPLSHFPTSQTAPLSNCNTMLAPQNPTPQSDKCSRCRSASQAPHFQVEGSSQCRFSDLQFAKSHVSCQQQQQQQQQQSSSNQTLPGILASTTNTTLPSTSQGSTFVDLESGSSSVEPTAKGTLLHDLPEPLMRDIISRLGARDRGVIASTCGYLRHLAEEAVPGLKLTLHPHQRTAVRWMLQREGRSGSMPHPFLRTWVTQEGLPLVLNLATGQIQTGTSAHGSRSSSLRVSQRNSGCSSHSLDGTHGFHSAANKIHDNTSQAACGSGGGIVVPDVRGGFFCDEPGLGKTVTALALILQTRGTVPQPSPGCSAVWTQDVTGRPTGYYTPTQDLLSIPSQGHPAKQQQHLHQQHHQQQRQTETAAAFTGQTMHPSNTLPLLAEAGHHTSITSSVPAVGDRIQQPANQRAISNNAVLGASAGPAAFVARHRSGNGKTTMTQQQGGSKTRRSKAVHDEDEDWQEGGKKAAKRIKVSPANGGRLKADTHLLKQHNPASTPLSPRSAKHNPNPHDAAKRIYLSPATLVVVPAVLVDHWVTQIQMHTRPGVLRLLQLTSSTGSSLPQHLRNAQLLPQQLAWDYDVVITTLEMLSVTAVVMGSGAVSAAAQQRRRASYPASQGELGSGVDNSGGDGAGGSRGGGGIMIGELLMQVHWLRIVLDEGHMLGGSLSMTNRLKMACNLIAERRWIMTGTPTPTTNSNDVAHLQPLLSFLHHSPYGTCSTDFATAVVRPFTSQRVEGRTRLVDLLRHVMIRSCKSDLLSLPKLHVSTKLLDFCSEHAASYNELVEVVQRNLLLADWRDEDHNESMLANSNRKYAREMMRNVRLSCCVAGSTNLVVKEVDVQEALELLIDKMGLDKLPVNEITGTVLGPPFTVAGHPLVRIETALRNGCACEVCHTLTKQPIVTPCAHLLCLGCAGLNREACPLPSCGQAYRMQGVEDPARKIHNPNPKWRVPDELIWLQPVYHQAGAQGLDGGQWSDRWEETRSTRCVYLLKRLREIGSLGREGEATGTAASAPDAPLGEAQPGVVQAVSGSLQFSVSNQKEVLEMAAGSVEGGGDRVPTDLSSRDAAIAGRGDAELNATQSGHPGAVPDAGRPGISSTSGSIGELSEQQKQQQQERPLSSASHTAEAPHQQPKPKRARFADNPTTSHPTPTFTTHPETANSTPSALTLPTTSAIITQHPPATDLQPRGILRRQMTDPKGSANASAAVGAVSTSHSVVVFRTKAIVYSSFWQHLRLLQEYLVKNGVLCVVFKKDINLVERRSVLHTFRTDPQVGVLLMDHSGSVGLDLSFASYVFLMEPLADRSLEQQVISRAHRMGAKGAVTVERLVMRNTAEQALDELNASATIQAAALQERNAQKQQQDHVKHKGVSLPLAGASLNILPAGSGVGVVVDSSSSGSVGPVQTSAPTDERGVNNIVFLRLRKVDVDALSTFENI